MSGQINVQAVVNLINLRVMVRLLTGEGHLHDTAYSCWKTGKHILPRQYVFASFPAAIGCIVQMAFACEQANHHPEIYQVYNRLNIDLTTHDTGCQVTQKDLDLARAIEAVAQNQLKT